MSSKKGIIRELKKRPCADCGETYPHWIMEFDHISVKYKPVGRMMGYSLSSILDEIDKCEIVCANCHKNRTWLRQCGE